MIIDAPAMVMAGLAISFIAGQETAPCPSGTIAVDVTSSADVNNLIEVIQCTGGADFNVSWHNSLHVEERIEVSHQKKVTVTGFGFPTIRTGLNSEYDDTDATLDLRSTTGIFSVHNDSSLILKQLVLDAGYSEEGGAVAVSASSALYVYDCGFTNNNASTGGAISASDSSEIYVDGETWFGNNSASMGGAIFSSNSTIDIDGSTTFDNNKADTGGAIYGEESTIKIYGNTIFDHNSATGLGDRYSFTRPIPAGGAMHVEYSVVFIGGRAEFSNNQAGTAGGAVEAYSSTVYMDGIGNIANNTAYENGGAFSTLHSSFYMDGSTNFFDNFVSTTEGGTGGAIFAVDSDIHMDGNTYFARNHGGSSGTGGAIQGFMSNVRIDGNASFVRNSAGLGGAIHLIVGCNLTITGSETGSGDLFGGEGPLYSDVGSDTSYVGGVTFIENVAFERGGAMYIADYIQIQVVNAAFTSNNAEFGGAAYLSLSVGKRTEFNACSFEKNQARDGGALYLYTGTGVDLFTECVFRDNFATFSGGAIFHSGPLRIINSSFVANMVGADGPAIMSLGLLETLTNVSFLENAYRCPAGQYGYVLAVDQNTLCTSCFDDVCARCANALYGVPNGEQVHVDGIPLCAESPPGVITLSSGTTLATLTLEKDYYRTSNHSHDVLKCYHEDACLGGNDTDRYCASGYEGPYCAVCAQGFAPGIAYSCRACSRGTRQSAIGLAVALALTLLPMAALLFLHLGSVVNEAAEQQDAEEDVEVRAARTWKQKCWSCHSFLVNMLPLTAIKIVVTVWQIISQFAAIAGDVYPEIYTKFVSKLNPINLNLDFVWSYSCIVATDFYYHLLFATITPPLMLLLLAGSYSIGKKRNSSSETAISVVLHKHQSAALYLALFVYSPVSYKIFQAFACDELDDGNTYLRADYSLSCSTPRHSAYEVYALIMVCVYPVGIIGVFAWLLARHRNDLVDPNRETLAHLQPLHGIWGAYRPSRFYYEVVECGRRIALTGIAAFVLPNSTAQIAIVFLVAFAFVFIAESVSPFAREVDTMLYRWGNGIIVASVYIALLMKLEVGNDSTEAVSAFSIVLIVANVAMFATVLLQTALVVMEWRRVRQAARLRAAEALAQSRRTVSLYSRYTGRED